jgi:hypothetical protein
MLDRPLRGQTATGSRAAESCRAEQAVGGCFHTLCRSAVRVCEGRRPAASVKFHFAARRDRARHHGRHARKYREINYADCAKPRPSCLFARRHRLCPSWHPTLRLPCNIAVLTAPVSVSGQSTHTTSQSYQHLIKKIVINVIPCKATQHSECSRATPSRPDGIRPGGVG